MIDLRFINDKQIKEYNLEIHDSCGMSFLNIKGTDFWVIGIDETTNTIYAQMDYGKVSWDHIRWLADANYHIAGVLTQHIPGLYDTREYEDFTLPAGYYRTAVFTIGEGAGKNWWCVIFPRVCVGVCSDKLETTVSKESANVAYQGEKYTVKFKTVEIFEKIKKFFNF